MANGPNLSIHFDGVDDFERAIDDLITRADAGAKTFVTAGGHLIEAAAKARAPVKTGTLRRSINVGSVTGTGLGMWKSETYPTTVYSRRIELGFHGDDSLGRHYEEAGTPYLSPGLQDALGALHALHESTMAAALEV